MFNYHRCQQHIGELKKIYKKKQIPTKETKKKNERKMEYLHNYQLVVFLIVNNMWSLYIIFNDTTHC